MNLNELVHVRSEGKLVPAVHLDHYDDAALNDRLCAHYIFTHATGLPPGHISSVGIIERAQDAFSGLEKNRFTVRGTYGTGKSHLALAVANFFGRELDSRAVQCLLDGLNAAAPVSHTLLRGFKQRVGRPFLVVRVTLTDSSDLRQLVRQAIRKALSGHAATQNHELEDSHQRAAEWLRGLSGEDRERCDDFLRGSHHFGIEELQLRLQQLASGAVAIARELSRQLLGLPLDFGADSSLKEALVDLHHRFCGLDPRKPFSGLVLLLDEFSAYLSFWMEDPKRAGGQALQELTDALDLLGTGAFGLFLTQRPLDHHVGRVDRELVDDFRRLTSRVEPELELQTNLEMVMDSVVVQGSSVEAEVEAAAPGFLDALGRLAYDSLPYYRSEDRLSLSGFNEHVAHGCFPLHPVTTGLLCSFAGRFGFVQGRSVLGFLAEYLVSHLSGGMTLSSGALNLLTPDKILDYFDFQIWNQDTNADLKLDYEACRRSLREFDSRDAEDVLGFGILKMIALCQIEGISSTSSFLGQCLLEPEQAMQQRIGKYVAAGILVQDESQELAQFRLSRGIGQELLGKVRAQAQKIRFRLRDCLGRLEIVDTAFKLFNIDPQLDAIAFQEDCANPYPHWRVDYRFATIESLKSGDTSALVESFPDRIDSQGVLLVAVAEAEDEVAWLKENVSSLLGRNVEFSSRVVLLVPERPVEEWQDPGSLYLACQLLPKRIREDFGELAIRDIANRNLDLLCRRIRASFAGAKFLVAGSEKEFPQLRLATRELFSQAYTRVPPVGLDQEFHGYTKGAGTRHIPSVTSALLRDQLAGLLKDPKADLRRFVNNAISEGDRSMGLVGGDWRILERPSQPWVAEAWVYLETHIQAGRPSSVSALFATLQGPPYGYDPNSFLLLLAAFIGRNRDDFEFRYKQVSYSFDHFSQEWASKGKSKSLIEWFDKQKVQIIRTERQALLAEIANLGRDLKDPADAGSLRRLLGRVDGLLNGKSPLTKDDRTRLESQHRDAQHMMRTVEEFSREFQRVRTSLSRDGSPGGLSTSRDQLLGLLEDTRRRLEAAPRMFECLADQVSKEVRVIEQGLERHINEALSSTGFESARECEKFAAALEELIAIPSHVKPLERLLDALQNRQKVLLSQCEALRKDEREQAILDQLRALASFDASTSLVQLERIEGEAAGLREQITDEGRAVEASSILESVRQSIDSLGRFVQRLSVDAKEVGPDLARCRNLYEEIIQNRLRFTGHKLLAQVDEVCSDLKARIQCMEASAAEMEHQQRQRGIALKNLQLLEKDLDSLRSTKGLSAGVGLLQKAWMRIQGFEIADLEMVERDRLRELPRAFSCALCALVKGVSPSVRSAQATRALAREVKSALEELSSSEGLTDVINALRELDTSVNDELQLVRIRELVESADGFSALESARAAVNSVCLRDESSFRAELDQMLVHIVEKQQALVSVVETLEEEVRQCATPHKLGGLRKTCEGIGRKSAGNVDLVQRVNRCRTNLATIESLILKVQEAQSSLAKAAKLEPSALRDLRSQLSCARGDVATELVGAVELLQCVEREVEDRLLSAADEQGQAVDRLLSEWEKQDEEESLSEKQVLDLSNSARELTSRFDSEWLSNEQVLRQQELLRKCDRRLANARIGKVLAAYRALPKSDQDECLRLLQELGE